VAHLVAGRVLLVLGELDGLAVVRRAVEAGEDALGDGPGAELEPWSRARRAGSRSERAVGVMPSPWPSPPPVRGRGLSFADELAFEALASRPPLPRRGRGSG
jgi:hypothetical protein